MPVTALKGYLQEEWPGGIQGIQGTVYLIHVNYFYTKQKIPIS
jgi:hypothetical protein